MTRNLLGEEWALALWGGLGQAEGPGGHPSQSGEPERTLQGIDAASLARNCVQSPLMDTQPCFLRVHCCFISNPITKILHTPGGTRFCSKRDLDSEKGFPVL